jgi:predicted nucleic acid-binding protein
MSGSSVLLDSVILIDHLNGVVLATSYLRSLGGDAHVSAITRAEVLTGLAGASRESCARFLDCFSFVSIDKAVADLAADLRREHGWKLPDAFQGATALHHGLHLATRDTEAFDPKLCPFVVVPYVLRPGSGVAEKPEGQRR